MKDYRMALFLNMENTKIEYIEVLTLKFKQNEY